METHGMIIKLKNRSCIVLTPGGEYREVALPKGRAAVGMEIPLPQKKSHPFILQLIAAASLFICILAWQLYPGQAPPAVAYLTIDINPSIELAVSMDKKVVSSRGLNLDGKKVLTGIKVKGLDLNEALGLIVARAVADQYLREKDDNVILATLTVVNEEEPLVDLESVCEAIMKPVKSHGLNSEVIIEPVKPELRQEAARSGISTGKYLLLKKSNKKGVPVSISEIQDLGLGRLEKEKKITLIELVDDETTENKVEGSSKKVTEQVTEQATEPVKPGKVYKQGIYIERSSKKEEITDDKLNEKVTTPHQEEKQDGNKKPDVREQNDKKKLEEKAFFLDRYNIHDLNDSSRAGNRTGSENNKNERVKEGGQRKSE